jgi:hypothetical protein
VLLRLSSSRSEGAPQAMAATASRRRRDTPARHQDLECGIWVVMTNCIKESHEAVRVDPRVQ